MDHVISDKCNKNRYLGKPMETSGKPIKSSGKPMTTNVNKWKPMKTSKKQLIATLQL